LEGIDEAKAFNWVSGNYIRDAFKDHVKKYRRLGTYTDPDGRKLDLLIVHLRQPWALERSRATQRNFVAEYLKQRGEKDAALIAYHVDDLTDWRFSFVKMQYREKLTEDGRVKIKEEFTPSRRYSFLVGQGEPSHTAQQQLVPLLDELETPTLDEIEHTFSVERVTKEFYTDYRNLFEDVSEALESIIEKNARVREEFDRQSIDSANFSKKLLGQIVFLYFLQKKGWLGVGRDKDGNLRAWGQGPKSFLRKLYNQECGSYANCFDEILEPLFYEALATEHADDFYSPFNCRIPFLNGGLFEAINDYNWREVDIHLPNDLIGEILDTFDRYNFTVREDDPLDQEVAVDPEMLGKVFENLLPENLRKGKGSYYTPRNVVHFMCQESLINFLDGTINRGDTALVATHKQQQLIETGEAKQIELQGEGRSIQVSREDLDEFIRRGEFAQEMDLAKAGGPLSYKPEGTKSYSYRVPESIRSNASQIDAELACIKVCDPAVGSGAFLVGMMHEIVKARSILTTYLDGQTARSPYALKRQCIHNSLYGVDIDPGAVDIAKLRLWLSLVVDEEEYRSIHPLPNLDYRIMQGNSLFEDFDGITLSVEDESAANTLLRRDASLAEKIEQLHRTQAEYFDAKHPREKKRLRVAVEDSILEVFTYAIQKKNRTYYEAKAQIERIASDVAPNLREEHLAGELRKLKARFELDPDELENELRELTHGNLPRDFFPWRLYFADVFQEKGGFDVVIENPPYVGFLGKEVPRERIRRLFSFATGRFDLYIPFIEKGLEICSERGMLCMICPTTFMKRAYAKRLREELPAQACLKLAIDFGHAQVFEAALNYTGVFVWENRLPLRDEKIRCADAVISGDKLTLDDFVVAHDTLRESAAWVLRRPDAEKIVKHIQSPGSTVALGELVGAIGEGIVTGRNSVFLVDQDTIEQYELEPSSIRPCLRGSDVRAYQISEPKHSVIYPYESKGVRTTALSESTLRARWPNTYAYLVDRRQELSGRDYFERSSKAWFELWNQRDADALSRPKIVVPELAEGNRFALANSEVVYGDTVCGFPVSEEGKAGLLLAILNSSLIEWYFKQTSVPKANGFFIYKTMFLRGIPMRIPEAMARPDMGEALNALAHQVVEEIGRPDSLGRAAILRTEIDQLVFELYEIGHKEREFIVGALATDYLQRRGDE